MPIIDTPLDNPHGIVGPNYLQVLFRGSILALLLVVPIIAYTNHIKRAAMVDPADLVQAPVAESHVASDISAAIPPVGSLWATEGQTDNLSSVIVPSQPVKLAAIHRSGDQGSGNGLLATKKIVGNKPIQRQTSKPTVRRRGPSQSISRTWYQNSRLKTTLIAIWRQTLKKPSKLKN